MKKDIFYCEQWSYGYKRLHKPFSEKQAEEKHIKGELYSAVIGSATQPEYVITLREEVDSVFHGQITLHFLTLQ